MRKYLVVCAAMTLLCSLVRAQEAEDAGSGAVLSIVPRFDAGMLYDFEGKEASFSFGNTSLYTLFEGDISQNWSFSIAGHWIGGDGWAGADISDAIVDPTRSLYEFHKPFGGIADSEWNFIDWANVTYSVSDFAFTLGKQMLLVGGWEFDNYDFDVNPLNASLFWNSFRCYQWGLSASWAASPSSLLTFQVAADPCNNKPSYALQWDGEYGNYSMKWSALGYRNYWSEDWIPVISLGNRLSLGDFTIDLDYISRCGDPASIVSSVKGHTFTGNVVWAAGEEWEIGLKASLNLASDDRPYSFQPVPAYLDDTFVTAGTSVSWIPADDIRIQANAGYSDGLGFALLGATYNFEFNIF